MQSWTREFARKLLEAYDKYEADFAKHRPSKRQGSKPFAQYAWDEFDPRQVMSILASPEGSFFAHKEVLFAGFCVWAVCPTEQSLIRDNMVLAAIDQLAKAEEEARNAFGGRDLLADMAARFAIPGLDFFREIYHPIGGLRAIANAARPDAVRDAIRSGSDEIISAIKLMRILHFHAVELRPTGRYEQSSVDAACKIVAALDAIDYKRYKNRKAKKISMKAVDYGNVKKRWRKYVYAIAVAYAASDVEADSSQSLLNTLVSGSVSFGENYGFITEWFGKATYANEQILAFCYTNPGIKKSSRYVFPVKGIDISKPEFDEEAVYIITKVFKDPANVDWLKQYLSKVGLVAAT